MSKNVVYFCILQNRLKSSGMKTASLLILTLLVASGFNGCKTTEYKPGNFPDTQLRWGNGGGIVGKETLYYLLDNGQLFKKSGNENIVEFGKIKAKKAKALYTNIEDLKLGTREFKHAGNTYQFVEVLNGDSVNRIVWGDGTPVEPDVQALYNTLSGLVQ